jgi:hypothetical protein
VVCLLITRAVLQREVIKPSLLASCVVFMVCASLGALFGRFGCLAVSSTHTYTHRLPAFRGSQPLLFRLPPFRGSKPAGVLCGCCANQFLSEVSVRAPLVSAVHVVCCSPKKESAPNGR